MKKQKSRCFSTRQTASQLVIIDSTTNAQADLVELSKYIKWYPEIRTRKIVIFDRVSSERQEGNLQLRKKWYRAVFEWLGFEVVAVFVEVVSGWKTMYETSADGKKKCQRWSLRRAVRVAKKNDAVVIAASVNRFRRHSEKTPRATLDTDNLKILKEEADGVILATLLRPEANESEVRKFESDLGRILRNKKAGRPVIKKSIRKKMLAGWARWLNEDMSLGYIAEFFEIPKSTAQGWCK